MVKVIKVSASCAKSSAILNPGFSFTRDLESSAKLTEPLSEKGISKVGFFCISARLETGSSNCVRKNVTLSLSRMLHNEDYGRCFVSALDGSLWHQQRFISAPTRWNMNSSWERVCFDKINMGGSWTGVPRLTGDAGTSAGTKKP